MFCVGKEADNVSIFAVPFMSSQKMDVTLSSLWTSHHLKEFEETILANEIKSLGQIYKDMLQGLLYSLHFPDNCLTVRMTSPMDVKMTVKIHKSEMYLAVKSLMSVKKKLMSSTSKSVCSA